MVEQRRFNAMRDRRIRISHLTDIDSQMTMALTATKGSRKPFTVKPLVAPTGAAAPKLDAATNWTRTFIDLVGQAADKVALDKLLTDRGVKLDELRQRRPELHTIVSEAIAARNAELDGSSLDDDPFAGPADEQRGEAHEGVADGIITEIDLRTTVPDINSYLSGQADTIAALSEEDRGQITEAQTARVAEIKGGAK